ncbi:MAG: multidrug effflux MFS transporter [Alphaproteobacteria bacterium]
MDTTTSTRAAPAVGATLGGRRAPTDRRAPAPGTMETPRRPPLALLVAMMASSQLAITIYLPSLPFMPAALATTQAMVQLVLTLYLAAFAAAQLFVGPLSDAFGRRRVLVSGLGLFTLASVLAAAAPRIEVLLAARVLQAMGACAAIVVSRAIIRDTSSGRAAARSMAYLGMSMAVAPAVAPVIGGQLQVLFGWRANFAVIAIVSALVWLAVHLTLRETLPVADRRPARLATLVRTYAALGGMRTFMGYSLTVAALTAGFHSFLAAAPIVLILLLGISPELYGVYTLTVPLGFMAGNFVSSRVTQRMGVDRPIWLGNVLAVSATLVLVAVSVAGVQDVAIILAPIVVLAFANGMALPNCLAGALSAVQPNMAGSASALGGSLQMLSGTVATLVIAVLVHTSSLQLALVLATTAILSFVFFAALTNGAFGAPARAESSVEAGD